MNCRKVQRSLPAYLERLLDIETQEALEGHVHGCIRCQRELAAYQKTLELAGRIEIEYPSPQAWEQFLPRLYAAIEADPHQASSRWRAGWERISIRVVPVAIVAMLLLTWLVIRTPLQPHREATPFPVKVISEVLVSDQDARALAQLTQVPLDDDPLSLAIADLDDRVESTSVEFQVDLQQLEQELILPEEELWGMLALHDTTIPRGP